MNFFDPRQCKFDDGRIESGKSVAYRKIVFDQLRLVDELHLPFIDTEMMSIVDRKYAIEYIEEKARVLREQLDAPKG